MTAQPEKLPHVEWLKTPELKMRFFKRVQLNWNFELFESSASLTFEFLGSGAGFIPFMLAHVFWRDVFRWDLEARQVIFDSMTLCGAGFYILFLGLERLFTFPECFTWMLETFSRQMRKRRDPMYIQSFAVKIRWSWLVSPISQSATPLPAALQRFGGSRLSWWLTLCKE